MKIDLNCLPIFVAVIEQGNFSAAAKRLHLTRSAVSKSISRLEKMLGIALFQRSTRHQVLTDEGMIFYEYSVKALESIHHVQSYLESGKLEVKGKVSITLPQLLGSLYITPILVDLMEQYPELQVEIILSDAIIDLPREGVQVAVRVGEIADSSQFIAHQIGNHRMTLCASPQYLANKGEPSTIDELKDHCLIAYAQSGKVIPWYFYDTKQKQSVYLPSSRLIMNDLQTMIPAVLRGFGIAHLPNWLIKSQIQQGLLVEILPKYQSINYPISVVWPKTHSLPVKTRVVIDAIRQHLPNHLALL